MKKNPEILWQPSPELKEKSNLKAYIDWLNEHEYCEGKDYHSVWKWSVEYPGDFWNSIIQYFDITYEGTIDEIISEGPMPRTRWFRGIRLNFAEHIFKNITEEYPAIIFRSESGKNSEVSWQELKDKTAQVAEYLRKVGVGPGDRVAAYLPNCPEATICFLACNSLGAIWSSTSPDFGVPSVIDRFQQIEPKVFIGLNGYQYNGRKINRTKESLEIAGSLPTVTEKICLNFENEFASPEGFTNLQDIFNQLIPDLNFHRSEFSHPIWVLYSSGTTGLPKPITQGHGGILLEHLKYLAFHNNVKHGDKCFWFTTTGWMMWNYINGALLLGGTVVQYDGSPAFPSMNAMWKLAADVGIVHFGTSAGFITANMKFGTHPGKDFDLKELVSIGSTGSPLPPEGFEWLYTEVKKDLWVASMAGGTDVCTAFVGGNPLWPVHSGEIQCRALGCNLQSFDENGNSMTDEVGEMVITTPMPSMPVYFWNDPGFQRYTDSYFTSYPRVWRHGDWIKITKNNGVIIYGRSDSTLNRGGVRIGTSEIYRAVEAIDDVKDSLIICVENEQGDFYMPLFLLMKEGLSLNEELRKRINAEIRKRYSPRHVPDEIIEAPDIPYTISGKKVELPVKKILMGQATDKSLNKDALKNPESLNFYIDFAKRKEI